ncbi:MAG: tripartite tricarboxylate transporter substrate binding protein [Pseudorhodoplanes sp.]|uniref:tripartite tricarboxylate transporter substrate binding protein n=1 Tax=Pseudorhodoplanes sp. TaxID=1934341 RepID=UPI003D0EDA23
MVGSLSRLIATAIAIIAIHPEPSAAQNFPSRNIELVVPYPPGAITDVTARALAEGMSKALGQSIVVVNKDGAAGTIGTGAVAAAPADGYVIGFSAMGTITGQPHLRKDLRYKVSSFDYLCQVTESFSVVIVSAEGPHQSLKSLLDAAKQNPGKLTYGHPGPGSIPHLQMVELAGRAGVAMTAVPFRGDAPARTALIGKHVDAVMSGDTTLPANIRALAVLGAERLPILPDVPSTGELGLGSSFPTPFGLFAPSGLPQEALSKLRAACATAVKSENFANTMTKARRDIRYLDGQVFGDRMAQHSQTIGDLVRNIDLPKN